jgi:twitching motility protein PilT
MFPNEEQNRVRLSLSGVLKGVVSQRLIPTIEGKRVAAMEILVKTPTIEKLILENRDYEIRDAIEKGREHYKSQSFDQHILDIYNQGIITKEKAKDYATSAADLELKMSGFNSGKASDFANMAEKKSKQEFSDDEVFDLK